MASDLQSSTAPSLLGIYIPEASPWSPQKLTPGGPLYTMAWVHIPVPSSTWQNPETPGCCFSGHMEDMGDTSLLILSKHCQGSLPTFLHSLETLRLSKSTCLPHAQALVPHWAASKLSSTEPVGGDGSSPLLPSSCPAVAARVIPSPSEVTAHQCGPLFVAIKF